MFDKFKADVLFNKLLKRPDINKAYAMVGPEDSWYATITKVHDSLAEIKKLPHEIVEIRSRDGLSLKAVYYPCPGSKTTVIWVHGYTSHAERESAFPGLFYRSLGCNFLIPYQRAHDISAGKYISFGAMEHLDMFDWVDKINEIIPEGNIIIHGLSMGGGIALFMSHKDMKNVRCLVSDAPSVSIEDFFKNVSKEFFKKNSDLIAEYAMKRFKKEFGMDAADFNALNIIGDCKYPLLLTAGSNEGMDDLLLEIKNRNPMHTEVLILPGCSHGNGMYKQMEMFQSAIKDFIEKHCADKI